MSARTGGRATTRTSADRGACYQVPQQTYPHRLLFASIVHQWMDFVPHTIFAMELSQSCPYFLRLRASAVRSGLHFENEGYSYRGPRTNQHETASEEGEESEMEVYLGGYRSPGVRQRVGWERRRLETGSSGRSGLTESGHASGRSVPVLSNSNDCLALICRCWTPLWAVGRLGLCRQNTQPRKGHEADCGRDPAARRQTATEAATGLGDPCCSFHFADK
jgi:hypothetical protein